MDWFGSGGTFEAGEWAFDFRVGGRDIAEGTFHDGPGREEGSRGLLDALSAHLA